MQRNRNAGAVEKQAISRVPAPLEERHKMTSTGNWKIGEEETCRNHQESLNVDQVTMKKRTIGLANRRETNGGWWRRANTGVYIKAFPSSVDHHHGKSQP
jgi:hypothetical protein